MSKSLSRRDGGSGLPASLAEGGVLLGSGVLLLVASKPLLALAGVALFGWGVYTLVFRKKVAEGLLGIGAALVAGWMFFGLIVMLAKVLGVGCILMGIWRFFQSLSEKDG